LENSILSTKDGIKVFRHKPDLRLKWQNFGILGLSGEQVIEPADTLMKERIYSIRKRKSYDGKDCYAVVVSMPEYRGGEFIEVGGTPEKWVFWTADEAYADCERRIQLEIAAGKTARLILMDETLAKVIVHSAKLDEHTQLIVKDFPQNEPERYTWRILFLDEAGSEYGSCSEGIWFDSTAAAIAAGRTYYLMELQDSHDRD
jgi:hypothetical protein